MPSFSNNTTTLKLTIDGDALTYAEILKLVAVTPSPVINSGVVTFPPGLTVADLAARATLLASCDAATTNITLSAGDKTLALSLVDAFYFTVISQEIVAFRAALFAAA
jgi:hypothetical protein